MMAQRARRDFLRRSGLSVTPWEAGMAKGFLGLSQEFQDGWRVWLVAPSNAAYTAHNFPLIPYLPKPPTFHLWLEENKMQVKANEMCSWHSPPSPIIRISHLATIKDVFTLDLSFRDLLPDGLSHFMLVVIHKSTVNVAVTCINGGFHRFGTSAFGGLPIRREKWGGRALFLYLYLLSTSTAARPLQKNG